MPLRSGLAAAWRNASISARYSLIAGLIMLTGMVVVGEWVARQVETGVVDGHAADAALYTDSIFAAHLQDLRDTATLSPDAKERVSALLAGFFNHSMVGFRIWKGDTIVHAERADIVGATYPASPARARAWSGEIVSEYRVAGDVPAPPRVAPGQRLLEIYAPVRRLGSSEIIALMETYEVTPALESELKKARLGSWLLIGLIGTLMQLLQIITVHGASRTIVDQRQALAARVDEMSRTLAENNSLRFRTQAGARMTENNERILRKVGADLHDGPLQLLGMAMLRLDGLRVVASTASKGVTPEDAEEFEFVCDALTETAREIRDIAAGLSLPEIESQSLEKVIAIALQRHQRLSGMPVGLDVAGPLPMAAPALKVCVYRLVQEGLSNVWRHAGGKGQAVSVGVEHGALLVSVLDSGPGPQLSCPAHDSAAQGINGLRDRVQALGGQLTLGNRPGGGARLTAIFNLDTLLPETVTT